MTPVGASLSFPRPHRHERPPEDVYGSWSPTPGDNGRVAFVSDRSGEPAPWLYDPRDRSWTAIDVDLPRVVTVSWSPDAEWLACVVAAAGASRSEVWLVRSDGSQLRQVAGFGTTSAVLGAGTWHGWTSRSRLMVTELDADATALTLDPDSGERRILARGRLLSLLDVDRGERHALLRCGPRSRRHLVLRQLGGGEDRPLLANAPGSTDGGCVSADGTVVYARTTAGREHEALVAVDISGRRGEERHDVLAEYPGAELEHLLLSPDAERMALTWNVHGGRSEVSVISLGGVHSATALPLPRDVVEECRFTPDSGAVLLTAQSWADPRGVWRIDIASGSTAPLSSTGGPTLISSVGASVEEIDQDEMAVPELHWLRSRDGLRISGWLYRPGRPGPWPTMIHLHGGPEAQERPVYNSLFQSLVAAGVAVFAPNVRGSSGFGRSFSTADDVSGRYAAIDDVAACVDHLISTGTAAGHQIGVMGRSYGGYLTLAALVWHPELFAVGVDVCGMSDLVTFYRDTERWIAAAAVSKYGHPERDAELLRDLSPMTRIERLRAPLLVVHGAEDTNVPVGEAEQLVEALERRGIEHRYLLFEGEGHELLSTMNRVKFVQETVAWVTRHLSERSIAGPDAAGPATAGPALQPR